MRDVKNNVVLITGGAGGIGRLMALDFAARGARVAVWDLRPEGLSALEAEFQGKGLALTAMICDVSNRDMVYRQGAALKAALGPVDLLVNNAGVVSGAGLLETSDEKIERTFQVNTLSLFWTCKAFLPDMLARNTGHIVTIASAAGVIGVRALADYSASKFAAFGFDESLRMELRRLQSAVRTTVVCPFFIDTGMFAGVKTRFPLLLPIQKSAGAARRIVRGIVNNRRRIFLPPLVHAVFLLRLLPVRLFDVTADFFGINHSMDDFRGRGA